ncbi:hypothetical protein [Actinokineospora diospyrosa]|uniref:Uncharacterized protein n=1 Tax=Actinokineospora diospyrosa TaxID=103728 RepID=A0ABT1IA26_9PSEU|nr:hypothetical protein [Actinokineospora diospyrosa]MCP2269487.1 hypothetical protein [Actinokineospora diospyrosa]
MGEQELADRETFWRWAEVVIAASFPLAVVALAGIVLDIRLPAALDNLTLLAGVVFGLSLNAYLVGEGVTAVRRPGRGAAGTAAPAVGLGLVVAFYLFCLVSLIGLCFDTEPGVVLLARSVIGVALGLGLPVYAVLRFVGGRGVTN